MVEKVLSRTFSTRRVRYTPGLGCADQALAVLIRGKPSMACSGRMLIDTLLAGVTTP